MEQLAVIKNVILGYDIDSDTLTMRFNTYITEGKSAVQRITGTELIEAFKATKACDANWFINKPCWVEISDGCIIYKRMFSQK